MRFQKQNIEGLSPYIKTQSEISLIEESCRIVADTLTLVGKNIRPGIETIELDKIAEDYILSKNGKPAFKGYRVEDNVYPYTLCISVNEEVIHGFPSDRKIKAGDIVSIDCGVEKAGFFGDSAYTFKVGDINPETQKLLDVTEQALMLGIEQAIDRNKVYDISRAVQYHVEQNGFSVTRDFVGHGVGRRLHEEPAIPNFVPALLNRNTYPNTKLYAGMTLAIEPMVQSGSNKIRIMKDGWTVITEDRKPAAHFEHTILVENSKPIILTLRD